jgi:hypothetical protein
MMRHMYAFVNVYGGVIFLLEVLIFWRVLWYSTVSSIALEM